MVKLFKAGTTGLFTEGAAVDAVRDGWCRSLNGVTDNAAQDAEKEAQEKSPEKATRKRPTRADVLELRQRAESAGVDKWDTAPLHRLRRALEHA